MKHYLTLYMSNCCFFNLKVNYNFCLCINLPNLRWYTLTAGFRSCRHATEVNDFFFPLFLSMWCHANLQVDGAYFETLHIVAFLRDKYVTFLLAFELEYCYVMHINLQKVNPPCKKDCGHATEPYNWFSVYVWSYELFFDLCGASWRGWLGANHV